MFCLEWSLLWFFHSPLKATGPPTRHLNDGEGMTNTRMPFKDKGVGLTKKKTDKVVGKKSHGSLGFTLLSVCLSSRCLGGCGLRYIEYFCYGLLLHAS